MTRSPRPRTEPCGRSLRRRPQEAAWDAWTKAAEDWLLERAGISQKEEWPYEGRCTAPVIRMRMPRPIATHQGHREVHGKAKIWTAQANRYRELARARLEHK